MNDEPAQPPSGDGTGWATPGASPAPVHLTKPEADQAPAAPPPAAAQPSTVRPATPPPGVAPSAPPWAGAPYQAVQPYQAVLPYPAAVTYVASAPPRPGALAQRPARVEQIPGTNFGVAYLAVPPTVSGPAVGSLVAGIGSILISTLVFCFGLAGAQDGWGPLVSGAFAVLAGLLGLAGVGLGLAVLRQVGRSGGRIRGKGLAISGISCGGGGVLLTGAAMLLSLLLTV